MKSMLTILIGLSLAPPAFAEDHEGPYGAIAYSDKHRNSYFVTDYPTQAAAEAAALDICRKDVPDDANGCSIPLWFKNSCGAIANASDATYGTGWGDTQELASQWAVDTCKKYGGKDCKTKMIACSPGGAMTIPAE